MNLEIFVIFYNELQETVQIAYFVYVFISFYTVAVEKYYTRINFAIIHPETHALPSHYNRIRLRQIIAYNRRTDVDIHGA